MTEEKQALLHKLRKETGMALMDCKRCFEDNEWDFDRALADHKRYRWDGRLINIKRD